MQQRKRVLMVACAFPPTGGSGVQRSVKFAKYLPRFGWLPTVWTAGSLGGMPRDPTLLEDLSGDVTVRAHSCSRAGQLARSMLQRMTKTDGLIAKLGRPVGWRLDARRIAAERNRLPDQYIPWAKASVEPLCRLIESERVDAIYSTFSPASNHWLALTLKRKTNLPWVADFRDLWTDDYRYTETSPRRRASHRRLEQEVLEAADVVVGVSTRQTDILASHLPESKDKFVTITNGFDPEDFADVPSPSTGPPREDVPFVLAHIGRLDRWRTKDAWFAGLGRFAEGLRAGGGRFTLRVVGHADKTTRRLLEDVGADGTFTGYVSHREAVREMCCADALLLNVPLGPNAESVIPAKLFEYLASGRPILVVGPPHGECEEIVRACRAGLAVGFDETAIADALSELDHAWRAGRPLTGCGPQLLDPFSRVTQTSKLTTILDRLTGDKPCDHLGQPLALACADSRAP